MTDTVCVRTGSRLHFGLLSLPTNAGEADSRHRVFGGSGLMIADPSVEVIVSPAEQSIVEGPLAGRVRGYADVFRMAMSNRFPDRDLPPRRLIVSATSEEHAGLGTGTQVALAIGQALAVSWGLPSLSSVELALSLGRGLRSAVGIHGFAHGGVLVEGGKQSPNQVSPLIARVPFPNDWHIVIVLPTNHQRTSGDPERQAFEELHGTEQTDTVTNAMCRLLVLGLLPALAEEDFTGFSEALYEYNRLAGSLFAPVQGGLYASAWIGAMIDFIRQEGIRAVGQSSWGPSVFAITDGESAARRLRARLDAHASQEPHELWVTHAKNDGATITRQGGIGCATVNSTRN